MGGTEARPISFCFHARILTFVAVFINDFSDVALQALPACFNPELRNGNGGCFKARHHCRAEQSGAQAHAVQTLARSLVRPGKRAASGLRAIYRRSFPPFLTRSVAKTLQDCPPASEFWLSPIQERYLPGLDAARFAPAKSLWRASFNKLRVRPALGCHPPDGKALEFRRGFQAELFLDVRPVHVHRFGA